MQKESTWSLKNILTRSKEILENRGLKALWFSILGEICYRRAGLYLFQINNQRDIKAGAGLKITEVGSDDIQLFEGFQPDITPKIAFERIVKGDFAFVVWISDEPAHICWASPGRARMDYLRCTLELPRTAVYFYNAYTHPRFRGQHLSSARFRWACQHLADAGFTKIFAITMPENQSAVRAIERSGYTKVGVIHTWYFGHRQHTKIKWESDDKAHLV